MQETLKIFLAQINPIIGDFAGNLKKIKEMIQSAGSCDVCVFPELSLCGYPPLDLIFDASFHQKQIQVLNELKNYAKDKLVIVGGIDSSEGEKPFYNTAFLLHAGEIKGKYHKMCLPTYDVFDEKRYFSEGKLPLVYTFKDVRFGLSICEDIWGAANQVKETRYTANPLQAYDHIDCLINLSASPYEKGKIQKRLDVITTVSKQLDCPVVYSAQVGAQDGILFDGGTQVVHQNGTLISYCKSFEEDFIIWDMDDIIPKKVAFLEPLKELQEALIMGVRDFFYKQGFNSCIIGVSGGVDSALTLALAVKALGATNVKAFMIPSLFTADMSLQDSYHLAERLNVKILTAPLGKVLTELEEMVKGQTSYQLKDITHQNMQARLRGLFLMAMSNQTGALVLTTGNKSELAVGYATLYGDMCGALSVLGDLYKEEVYALAKAIHKKENIFPERIFTRAPSAELCFGQTDQDNLPPYELLDAILQLAIEEGYSKDKVQEAKQFPPETVEWTFKKLFQVEYKRKQYAPVLKVSKKTFNTGRNVPIVQKLY